jgi:formylglycine-generating enzyme required for sulfatase activity
MAVRLRRHTLVVCLALVLAGAGVMFDALKRSEAAPLATSAAPSTVAVPAGSVSLGKGKDARRVAVAAFVIDATEVTVGQYRECVAAGACWLHLSSDGWQPWRVHQSTFCNAARDDRDDHPINCVDWYQADAYCRFRGATLPTMESWRLAAVGPRDQAPAWSDPKQASEGGQRGGTAPVGGHPASASPSGVLGAAGNVSEWTATAGVGSHGIVPLDETPHSGLRWYCGGDYLGGGSLDCVSMAATYRSARLGFRCERPRAAP